MFIICYILKGKVLANESLIFVSYSYTKVSIDSWNPSETTVFWWDVGTQFMQQVQKIVNSPDMAVLKNVGKYLWDIFWSL